LDQIHSRVRTIIINFVFNLIILISRIWVSPKFPLIKEDSTSDGNSKTNFKIDILRYLKSFDEQSLSQWIEKVEKVDFSQAK